VYEKLDQPDEIKVKCRDFPLGKALPFPSQTWTKREAIREKRGHLKRALIYAVNEKKSKLDPILPVCREKRHQGP